MNAVVFYDRVLSLLWLIPAHMGINLNMIWFKSTFCVCTGLFITPYCLTKKKKRLFMMSTNTLNIFYMLDKDKKIIIILIIVNVLTNLCAPKLVS